ncbi:MAG: DUF4282 domain-containing protein [Anaerolineaceae bacterium]|jgi:hypothetical protein|nr:DUF4282 domain-containing protein [Anaerolineaceae bacterium]
MGLKRLASFERMVTPVIIRVLFWIGVVISILSGLGVVIGGIITAIDEGFVYFLVALVGGPVVMFLGILSVRIYAELLILAFRINETLTDIKVLLEKQA